MLELLHGGLDSSYHVWTNMSVKGGIIWDISAHSIHKGDSLIFLKLCIIKKAIKSVEVKVDVEKGGPRVWKKGPKDVLVWSKSRLCPLLSYGNTPQ
jgi:hypothetical protein